MRSQYNTIPSIDALIHKLPNGEIDVSVLDDLVDLPTQAGEVT